MLGKSSKKYDPKWRWVWRWWIYHDTNPDQKSPKKNKSKISRMFFPPFLVLKIEISQCQHHVQIPQIYQYAQWCHSGHLKQQRGVGENPFAHTAAIRFQLPTVLNPKFILRLLYLPRSFSSLRLLALQPSKSWQTWSNIQIPSRPWLVKLRPYFLNGWLKTKRLDSLKHVDPTSFLLVQLQSHCCCNHNHFLLWVLMCFASEPLRA